MPGKVLLINHGAALMTDALIASVRGAGIEALRVEPDIDRIAAEKDGTDVILLFAGDYVFESLELLVYLRDLCFNEEKLFCVVGYEKELVEIGETIPKNMIAHAFLRPVDVKSLSTVLNRLISAGGAQKTENHILLVDDDVTFLQMMQSWLSTKYSVTVARSGMQALTYIGSHKPDLILLDYDMPITPGPQVLEMIRSEPDSAQIPVIFLTGKNDRESVERVMRLKPDGYLLKTMGQVDIMNSVERFFETKKWEDLYV